MNGMKIMLNGACYYYDYYGYFVYHNEKKWCYNSLFDFLLKEVLNKWQIFLQVKFLVTHFQQNSGSVGKWIVLLGKLIYTESNIIQIWWSFEFKWSDFQKCLPNSR